MADSIYESMYGAGSSTGSYQASLYSASAEKDLIGTIQQQGQMKQQDTQEMIGNLQSLLAVGSQLYGGWKDKKIFKEETLPGMEKRLAKQSWEEMTKKQRVRKAKGLGEAVGTETDFKLKDLSEDALGEYFKQFEYKEEKQTTADWIFGQDKRYTFGEGKDAYTFSKSDIQSIDLYGKYGMGNQINLSKYAEVNQ